MTITPTAADRAKAEELLTDSGIVGGYGPWNSYVREIAQALADAREEGRRSVGDLLRTYVPKPQGQHDQRRTPQEWCELRGVRILDPDGWRSADAPDWDEPITEQEFDERAAISTAGPWNWATS